MHEHRLLMNHAESAVMFTRRSREFPEDSCLSVGDMFAGGFSGWAHATTALSKFGLNIRHDWAVEINGC